VTRFGQDIINLNKAQVDDVLNSKRHHFQQIKRGTIFLIVAGHHSPAGPTAWVSDHPILQAHQSRLAFAAPQTDANEAYHRCDDVFHRASQVIGFVLPGAGERRLVIP
jgi:hypothetical protein